MDCASSGSPTSRALLYFSALALALALGAGCARRKAAPRDRDRDRALAAIAGRAVSLAGLPLAGGDVILDQDREADGERDRVPVATERLSAAGTFRILNVPPGRYRLRGHAAGHADSQVRLEVRAGETLATVLRLAPAETLSGKVVDHRGQALPSARLLIWSLAEPDAKPGETFTDAQGAFVLTGLNRGPHRLIAEAPGFGSMQRSPIEVPSPGGVIIAMEVDGSSLGGLVTAAGRPAGGAHVLVGGENLALGREIAANADGSFQVHGLGPGVYVLRAWRGDQVSPTSGEVVIEPSGERTPPVRLELAAGWSISGRVVDDTGRPSPGSEIRIEAVPGDDPLPGVVRADETGAWKSGPLPMGEYRLTPRQPGFVARRALRTLVGPRGAPSGGTLVLELVRGAQITGRVVDQRGAPVRDATVRCVMPGREDLSVIGDRLPLAAEAAASPSGSGHALGPTRTVSTDSSGHFELQDVLPGRFFLEASHDGRVPQRAGPFPLVPGQKLEAVALVLLDGVHLTGRVTDQNDVPIDGARVALRRLAGPAPARGAKPSPAPASGAAAGGTAGEEEVLATDGGGRFTAAVAEGESLVSVSAAGMLPATVTVLVSAGSAPAPLAVRLGRADARFDGLARDAAGRDVVGAQAIAWPVPARLPSGELSPIPDGAVPFASAVTDAGGHFQLTRLPRGQILVEVKHPSYPRAAEIVLTSDHLTPGVPVTIQLAVPGGIEGEVREKVTGAIISTYRIEAHGPEGRVASPARKNGARFVLARLLPGRWTLSVRAPGYGAGETTVDVAPSGTLGESSVRELRIELAPELGNQSGHSQTE